MQKLLKILRERLFLKLNLAVGLILLLSLSGWGYFNIKNQKEKAMQSVVEGVDRLSHTVRLGAHYAMMLNSRDDIRQIITNIASLPEIENIRIYNKQGQIKFSSIISEIDQTTNIKDEACYICHRSEPPTARLALSKRIRIFHSEQGQRMLGVISPIYNEPGCATDSCHIHPAGKKVLGALDLVISLGPTDSEIGTYEKKFVALVGFVFAITTAMICVFIIRFVNLPIRKLIAGTRQIENGNYLPAMEIGQSDELGQLAAAINQMGRAIGEKQTELNRQRDEYQSLFELVPCIVTVQDRDYRLIGYNREFAEKFGPLPGDHCYWAYKGRQEKCLVCPVEKTFNDGRSHYSEESGIDKDGTAKHWLVKTAPIRDADGRIIAAMEMNLDITERKELEKQLARSEKKYHEIFNNIPNPVFVLDYATLHILDCNDSVMTLYGHAKEALLDTSFLDLFVESSDMVADEVRTSTIMHQVKHHRKNGRTLFVNVRISPSEYPGRQVLLVTISDVTKRLETEQQLIQASKMATLGEMATGVAHELNQPLAVIKTASSFFMKKIRAEQPIKPEILLTMCQEIDSHVDRATKIINHMRQFGRKTDPNLEKVQINDVLTSAFEIFHQQLRVRGIAVKWDVNPNLSQVLGNSGRLEQVFINLLINARDSIEEKSESTPVGEVAKQIAIVTLEHQGHVWVKICDTGSGIPPAVLSKIFEPFFTTKRVGKGTGLGLSISYGIIKECGGSIFAENRPEGGACFTCKFPVPGGGDAA